MVFVRHCTTCLKFVTALISGEAVMRVIFSSLQNDDKVSAQETPAIPPPITTILAVLLSSLVIVTSMSYYCDRRDDRSEEEKMAYSMRTDTSAIYSTANGI